MIELLVFLPFIWLLVWFLGSLGKNSHRYGYTAPNDGYSWRAKDKSKCGTNILEISYRSRETGKYCATISNAYVKDGLMFIETDTPEEAQRQIDEKFKEWEKEWYAK